MQKNITADILKKELGRRCANNPRYSLRAFAKKLEISPANLSLVMNGKRSPSRKTLEKIMTQLDLSSTDKHLLWKSQSQALDPSVEDNIDLETVERICHWTSYAILSLFLTKDFQSSPAWVAKRLGVSIHEIKISLEAMSTLKLIDISRNKWVLLKTDLRINNKVSSAVTRSFQKQVIQKALESMENDSMSKRDLTSITFAMSPEKMELAKEEIRKFRLSMSELFEEPSKSEEVYNLTVQLVPVTRRI